jgi:bla regulator protein blaR1
MSASLLQVIAELTIAASVAIGVVAAIRKPLTRLGGARVAYLAWLLVPTSQLVVLLPAPSRAFELTAQTIPQFLRNAMPAVTSLGHGSLSVDYALIGVIVWACGSLSLLFFTLRRQKAFIRSLGALTAMPDGTYRSSAVRGPLLVGTWRPRVVLPVDFESLYDVEEGALVLAHERAHRDRGDQLVNVIAAIWLCLSWFNPLMYWAIARLRFDQELCCDAVVLGQRPTVRRRYANALLRTQLAAESGWRAPIVCSWQSGHPLTERITMLKRPLPTLARRHSALALTCALIISGTYAVWTALPRVVDAQESAPASTVAAAVLNDAIRLLNTGQFAEAKLAVGTLELNTLSPFERSHVEMVLFNLALVEGRYDDARDHLERTVDAGGLSPEVAARVRETGMQALLAAEGN